MQKKIDKLILKIGKICKEKNLSLVTAESCTGGGVAFHISKQPSVSSILERGFIAYSNPSKQDLLSVKPGTLQLNGAVSKEVALEMASGALENSQAQISIAITGIAGADMVSKSGKDMGIVWVCCLDFLGNKIIEKKIIRGTRGKFIESVIYASVKQLEKFLHKFNTI